MLREKMVRRVLPWVAILVACLIGYVLRNAFGISEQTLSLGALAMMLLVASWHFSQRLDTLEERVVHKDYSDIKAAIEQGQRHKPQHQQP